VAAGEPHGLLVTDKPVGSGAGEGQPGPGCVYGRFGAGIGLPQRRQR
jgi:hypothetical protein